MNIEAALSHLDQVLDAAPLNSIHEKIFRLSWDGKTYEEIATLSNHDTDYIRHLGQQLWQKLSTRDGTTRHQTEPSGRLPAVITNSSHIKNPSLTCVSAIK